MYSLGNSGYLSIIDLDEEELQMYVDYLQNTRDLEFLPYLQRVLGDDFLMFLDLFAGEVIKIPTRSELIKISSYIIIYNYLKQRDFSEDAYKKASSLFKRRASNLRRVVEKVESVIKPD